MQKEFALISRLSLSLSISLLAACGGDATKPEWSRVVYTETPVLYSYDQDERLIYRYPVAGPVIPHVFAYADGYGIPLHIERFDGSEDLQFLTLDVMGNVTSRDSEDRVTEELHRSASGLWLQERYGAVSAFDEKGNMLWQRQLAAGDASNTTGEPADFISVKKSWVSNDDAPGAIDTLMLTGLAANGAVLWQQVFSGVNTPGSYTAVWNYAQDDQGQVCFNNQVESPQLIQCLNPDGTQGSQYTVSSISKDNWIDLSNERLAVVSETQSALNVELFDRATGKVQSSSIPVSESAFLIDSEFSSDGQFNLTYEASDAVTLLTVTGDGREYLNEISRYPGYGERERSTYFSGGLGKIGADAKGNIYVITESWGEGAANGNHYRTVRSVIKMQTASGVLSNVVLGHLSKFHYEKNGECIRRCAGFSGAKVLNDLAVQPDGRLITGWADSTFGFVYGDMGTGGLVPFRKAVIVASYVPVPLVKPE